jgi:hypothetical protein
VLLTGSCNKVSLLSQVDLILHRCGRSSKSSVHLAKNYKNSNKNIKSELINCMKNWNKN